MARVQLPNLNIFSIEYTTPNLINFGGVINDSAVVKIN
jgi:hypothetical protein